VPCAPRPGSLRQDPQNGGPPPLAHSFARGWAGLPPFWPSSAAVAFEDCLPPFPLPWSIVAQLRGTIMYKEGNSFTFSTDVFASPESAVFPRCGPPPAPWAKRPALFFPSGKTADCVAALCVTQRAEGFFVGAADGAWRTALSSANADLWSVKVCLSGRPDLLATFFDASGAASQRTKRRGERSTLPPLEPLPNWPDGCVLPVLVAFSVTRKG
jgi:hypothetical protein